MSDFVEDRTAADIESRSISSLIRNEKFSVASNIDVQPTDVSRRITYVTAYFFKHVPVRFESGIPAGTGVNDAVRGPLFSSHEDIMLRNLHDNRESLAK